METEGRILSIRQEAPSIKSFVFEPDDPIEFLPGQYIDVVVEGVDVIVGGYSITSSPLHPDRIHITAKRLSDKPTSVYLNDRASVGEYLFLVGPTGTFTFREDDAESVVLIGGGIGITPLMSMARYIDEAHLARDVTLVHSAKSPQELLFHDDLSALERSNPRFRYVTTVTGPAAPQWQGRRGRIDAELLEDVGLDTNAMFYVCGPPGMPQDIGRVVQGLGVDTATRLKAESW